MTCPFARVTSKSESCARQPLRIGTPQGFWGSGYFNEDSERAPPNLLKAVENKKLLSTAGRLKLLSGADKAGLNLAKVAAKHVQRSSASCACLFAPTMHCLLCIDHTDGDAQCCFCHPQPRLRGSTLADGKGGEMCVRSRTAKGCKPNVEQFFWPAA
jgi:hypothetical protein